MLARGHTGEAIQTPPVRTSKQLSFPGISAFAVYLKRHGVGVAQGSAMPTRSRFPQARTAVLLVDVINPFDFPGGEAFARRAVRTARAIARLADRARRARVPVIYVNDNLGRWRSDIASLLAFCTEPTRPGSAIAGLLPPHEHDHVVLKSTLSGFFQTPLETMLRSAGATTLVLAGFATDNCVMFTAADAYMRDFRLIVASDCVAAQSQSAQSDALKRMRRLLKARVTPSALIRLQR
jgi:nicotinamidase-related amidase